MSILLQLAAALAVALLRYVLANRQLMEEGQRVEYEEALRRAERALSWKTIAATRPDGGSNLGVRPGAEAITIPGLDPDPPSVPTGTSVPSSGGNDVRGTT